MLLYWINPSNFPHNTLDGYSGCFQILATASSSVMIVLIGLWDNSDEKNRNKKKKQKDIETFLMPLKGPNGSKKLPA